MLNLPCLTLVFAHVELQILTFSLRFSPMQKSHICLLSYSIYSQREKHARVLGGSDEAPAERTPHSIPVDTEDDGEIGYVGVCKSEVK